MAVARLVASRENFTALPNKFDTHWVSSAWFPITRGNDWSMLSVTRLVCSSG
jgi:hypothetical protein